MYLIGPAFNLVLDVLTVCIEAFPESAYIQLAHVRCAANEPDKGHLGFIDEFRLHVTSCFFGCLFFRGVFVSRPVPAVYDDLAVLDDEQDIVRTLQ